MITYTVRVQSSGVTADWDDDIIVIAAAPNVAESLAKAYVREQYPFREVGYAHALRLTTDRGRVIGQLVAPDE